MTYIALHHQGAIKMFWPQSGTSCLPSVAAVSGSLCLKILMKVAQNLKCWCLFDVFFLILSACHVTQPCVVIVVTCSCAI